MTKSPQFKSSIRRSPVSSAKSGKGKKAACDATRIYNASPPSVSRTKNSNDGSAPEAADRFVDKKAGQYAETSNEPSFYSMLLAFEEMRSRKAYDEMNALFAEFQREEKIFFQKHCISKPDDSSIPPPADVNLVDGDDDEEYFEDAVPNFEEEENDYEDACSTFGEEEAPCQDAAANLGEEIPCFEDALARFYEDPPSNNDEEVPGEGEGESQEEERAQNDSCLETDVEMENLSEESPLPPADSVLSVEAARIEHLRIECLRDRLSHAKKAGRERFGEGRFEDAIAIFEAADQLESAEAASIASAPEESTIDCKDYVRCIRAMMSIKSRGNDAWVAGNIGEALRLFSSALDSERIGECKNFYAACFADRARALVALADGGSLADALGDLDRAVALCPDELTILAMRANLRERVRDWEGSREDLERLVSLLQPLVAANPGRCEKETSELLNAGRRLERVVACARSDIPIDPYLILGFRDGDNAKKLFRKLSLRHHSDKARGTLSDPDGSLWKDVGEAVTSSCDHLFTLLTNAARLLSDPSKKTEYDWKEEQRKRNEEQRRRYRHYYRGY